jgi:VWFA-related protein
MVMALAAILASTLAWGQQNSTVTFTSHANLVLIPVVVGNKSGAHISGLTKDDFEIREDGKSRSLATLEEINTSIRQETISAAKPGFYTNVLSSDHTPKDLTILVLDLVNTPLPDQAYARGQMIKYLARRSGSQEPSALLAIRPSGLQVLHDFSSDPVVLMKALQQVTGQTSTIQGQNPNATSSEATLPLTATSNAHFNANQIVGESQRLTQFMSGNGPDAQVQASKGTEAIMVTLQAFQHVSEAVAGIPGRKSLIWVTASFPLGLDPTPGGIHGRTLQMLNDANVAVYPVDARGPVVFFGGADLSRIEGVNALNDSLFEGSRNAMVDLAAMTGGQAFLGRNDLDVAFQEAADDSASYYVLGYYLDKNIKPGWHKLDVKVKRSGSQVRARSGFFLTPKVQQEDIRNREVRLALLSPLEYTALPMVVQWRGVRVGSPTDGPRKGSISRSILTLSPTLWTRRGTAC